MNNVTVTGLSSSNKKRLHPKMRRAGIVLSEPAQIEVLTPVFYKQQHSLWHGGDTATIAYRNWKFVLNACGDVYASLYDRQRDEEVLYVKDKCNEGRLASEISPYIETDSALMAALKGVHTQYDLTLDHNNWWEGFAVDPHGNFLDLMWCLDSDFLLDAVVEVLQAMDEVIRENS